MSTTEKDAGILCLIGASRGLGLALASEFLQRGWRVLATQRGEATDTPLHALAQATGGRLEIEALDINEADQIDALRLRLQGRRFDILFVNAGITTVDPTETLASVSTEEFCKVMITNSLSPVRVIEALGDTVLADGVIGVMSSGQGSIANNQRGRNEVYRGSKAALNMNMCSYAARKAGDPHGLLLLAPGWIRTDLGGPDAPFTLEESAPILADLILARRGERGLKYLDRNGHSVPW